MTVGTKMLINEYASKLQHHMYVCVCFFLSVLQINYQFCMRISLMFLYCSSCELTFCVEIAWHTKTWHWYVVIVFVMKQTLLVLIIKLYRLTWLFNTNMNYV